jgi:hypothetical protein
MVGPCLTCKYYTTVEVTSMSCTLAYYYAELCFTQVSSNLASKSLFTCKNMTIQMSSAKKHICYKCFKGAMNFSKTKESKT